MIIDFHTHVFPPGIIKKRGDYINSDPGFAILYSDSKNKLATTDDLISSMDKAGIDVSVILNTGWTTHELCVETNDYILESIARYPDRLIGFCAVQPRSIDAAITEIERCAKAGAKGIGELRPDTQLLDLADKEIMDPFMETIRKHNLILLIHASEPVGHIYAGKGSITPDILYPFIEEYDGLPMVCAHWGGGLPFYELMPEVKKTLENTFFDTAASPFLYNPQVYKQVVQVVGADKVLFGSDYPLLQPERLIKEIDSLDLSQEEKEKILSGNAKKLLGLDGA